MPNIICLLFGHQWKLCGCKEHHKTHHCARCHTHLEKFAYRKLGKKQMLKFLSQEKDKLKEEARIDLAKKFEDERNMLRRSLRHSENSFKEEKERLEEIIRNQRDKITEHLKTIDFLQGTREN